MVKKFLRKARSVLGLSGGTKQKKGPRLFHWHEYHHVDKNGGLRESETFEDFMEFLGEHTNTQVVGYVLSKRPKRSKFRGITVAVKDGAVGVAYCSVLDQFKKSTGRTIALGRLHKKTEEQPTQEV